MVKMFPMMVSCILLLIPLLGLSAIAEPCAYYFYGEGCKGCAEASQAVSLLQQKVPDLHLQKHELFFNPQNVDLLQQYYAAYGVAKESQGLPVLLLDKTYYIGAQPIKTLAERAIQQTEACPSLVLGQRVGVVGEHADLDVFESLPFFLMTSSALQDAFRPGMLALFVLFLMLMISSPAGMAKRAMSFLSASFLAILLFALGFFTWFATAAASVFFYRVLGLVAILYGLLVIKHFFWPKSLIGVTKDVELFWNKGGKVLASSFGMFVLGFGGGLFSVAHVQPVLLSLRFAFRTHEGWLAIPVVLYYVLVSLLPLLISLAITLRWQQRSEQRADLHAEHVEKWKLHHHKLMRLAVAVLCIVIGIFILF